MLSKKKPGEMKYLGVCRQRNVLNTKRKQTGFAHWKAKFRQAR